MTDSSLLIIHQGALGDVVMTFPAITALRKKFGRIDILCQGQLGKLAAGLGLADKAYPLEAAYVATLFSKPVDKKIKTILAAYSTILLFSFGSDLKKSIRQISDGRCFQIPPRPPVREKINVAEFILKNLLDCGLLKACDFHNPHFTRQERRFPDTVRPVDSLKILIHPGAGSIRKRWSLARFLELADILEKKGLGPQFICGPAEQDLADELAKQNRPVHGLGELTDLADLLESAGGYIGNDSGVSHLASFLRLPSVVIFGPTDPLRWKPTGPRVEIVRPELDCNPCFEIEPENCPDPRCLTDASVEAVVRTFERAYQR
ncbi:MAG: glycosyltransferase family 9 protein [Desulfobacterales bacterium]|jgi:ADP-heptose:LPS heptosyltransferase